MPKHEKNAEQHSNTGKPATGNASDNTVAERIRANFHQLTRAERQLANTMLENYPVSGLGSITALAETSDVSAPTIVRMAKKLGFRGFPQLQSQLRHEVEETISNPITRHNRWSEGAPDAHLINRFAEAVMQNLRQTLANLDPGEFDEACAMMGDLKHAVHVAGGRITGTLAEYLFRHLQMIRPGTTLVPSTDSHWPHYVLDMHDGDTLVLYDVRRYENNSVKLAEIAAERGVNPVYRPVGIAGRALCQIHVQLPDRGPVGLGFHSGDAGHYRNHDRAYPGIVMEEGAIAYPRTRGTVRPDGTVSPVQMTALCRPCPKA